MEESIKKESGNKKVNEAKTFTVPFSLEEIKGNSTNNTHTYKEQVINKAFKLHSQGNISEATKYYEHLISQDFNDHRVFSNYGAILKSQGKLKEAEKYTRTSIELNPKLFNSHFLLAKILIGQNKLHEAIATLYKTIELKPDLAEAHLSLGAILKEIGKSQEAENACRKSILLKPNLFKCHFLLANILIEQNKLHEAEATLRKTIELKPDLAEAHLSLGIILSNLDRLKEAELSQRKAIEIKPDFANAYSSLAMTLVQQGNFDLSLKYFSNCSYLLRGTRNSNPNQMKFREISKTKMYHDIEQFEYLASNYIQTEKFTELATLYRKIALEINWPSETKIILLGEEHTHLMKKSYNLLTHQIEAPKLQEKAVNNSLNVERITNTYFNHDYGLTYFDNFLSDAALTSLREFLLGSTIWFEIKESGYLGAYLKEGLANPLILQISEELRNKFPKIFKDHPIKQIWAYKYDSRAKNENSSLKGTNIHADFAAVNVNFWITPNEANLNPDSGALIVYDVEAPKNWNFKTYNNDEIKIREELKKSKGNTKVIPHKENRAVVFNSNLFHETDKYEFKEGYINRRINVTMLFGKRNTF